MSNTPHISADPDNAAFIFTEARRVCKGLDNGSVKVDVAAQKNKALVVGVKALEVDLHTRMFSNRVSDEATAIAAAQPVAIENKTDKAA